MAGIEKDHLQSERKKKKKQEKRKKKYTVGNVDSLLRC
jgi:hypothetical protein